MKNLSKLKLNVLNEQNLKEKEMNNLRGGEWCCSCSCLWVNQGGSSSNNNSKANYNSPTQNNSPGGSNCYVYCCNDTYDECGSSYIKGGV